MALSIFKSILLLSALGGASGSVSLPLPVSVAFSPPAPVHAAPLAADPAVALPLLVAGAPGFSLRPRPRPDIGWPFVIVPHLPQGGGAASLDLLHPRARPVSQPPAVQPGLRPGGAPDLAREVLAALAATAPGR